MATPTEWLNEFQVNSGTAATGSQSNPKIVGLNNGHFVVAWEESASGLIGTTPGTDIVAKIYNTLGNVVRDSFRLNVFANADDERDFDLTATHDGFALTAIDDDISSVNQTSVVYERFDFAGDRLSGPGTAANIQLENVAADFLRNPQITSNLIATNDDIFVAYDDDVGTDTDINARVIDQNGNLGAEFAAAQNSNDFDRLGDVTVLSNGNFVTVYEEDDSGTTSLEFTIRTAAGGVVGLNAFGITSDATDPNAAPLEGGGFVVTFVQDNDILFRIYDNAGTFQDSGIAASGFNNQNEPVVTGLPDGDFVIAWDDDTSGNLFARRFNPDGTADGSTFIVENVATTQIDISTSGDGRILFAWRAELGEIFASIWDPREATIDPDDYNGTRAHVLDSDDVSARRTDTTILAGAKGDFVLGLQGNDTIFSSSDGSFFGGGGNDTIHAGPTTTPSEFELLNGGPGNDTLITTSFSGDYTINLITGETDYPGAPLVPVESFINFENVTTGVGDDSVTGTAGANVINTLGGNDTIIGGGGNDTLNGGNGSDSILGGAGFDLINGGSSSDTMNGGNGDDTVNGGNGRDLANLGNGNDTYSDTAQNDANGQDTVNGGAGNDTINGGGGNDELNGEDGNDLIIGGNGNDVITGGANFDTLNAGNGNDTVNGGNGRDLANLGNGNDNYSDTAQNDINGRDTVNGGDGDDVINGGGGNDLLNGQGDNDLIFGVNGFDMLNGGNGSDTLNGGNGNDTLNGGNGNDTLNGGNNNDVLNGGNNNDRLIGGSGDDTLNGGNGNDIMNGNAGNDVFIFANGFGNDTIEGFEENNNLEDIDLSAVASIVNFADLTANHMGQVGTDVVINAGGGNIITITNVDIADMNFGDFLF